MIVTVRTNPTVEACRRRRGRRGVAQHGYLVHRMSVGGHGRPPLREGIGGDTVDDEVGLSPRADRRHPWIGYSRSLRFESADLSIRSLRGPTGACGTEAARNHAPTRTTRRALWGFRVTVRYAVRELSIANPESVAEKLLEDMLVHRRQRASPAEQQSWRRSLPVLAYDLDAAGLGSVEVLLEYQMPLTSQRADAVLAGFHPRTGNPSYVVIELKQWSAARHYEDDPNLVTVPAMPGGPKLHPSRQVSGYCSYIVDFVRALDGDESSVAGAAYLHNALSRESVLDLFDYPLSAHGQLFIGSERAKFQQFLTSRLAGDSDGAAAADALLDSAISPSKQLLTLAADEVRDRQQFRLLGNQQLAVDEVMHAVRRARNSNQKTAVVIAGGPGSGKSVVALSLLGDLAREGREVLHATGSRSFTQTLRQVAGRREPRVQKLFKYFNSFMEAEMNGLDVLILDEAHRIRETSVNRYTRAHLRTGRPQVEELLDAARVPVFLLDQNQVVRPGEMGAVDTIRSAALALGLAAPEPIVLGEQFRCGGSAAYVEWVERLLGLADGGPAAWDGDPAFDVRVAETPEEMEQLIGAKHVEGSSARMSAGYCWRWSDPTSDGQLVADVSIGSWARPWNVKGDKRVGDAPPSALWASEPGGIDQVGCVYTAQGFEYDWSGIIIGPDLVWRDGGFVSQRAANRDPDFRNTKTVSDGQFDDLVRNVYKVLLTRGMAGTIIYSTDQPTRTALRGLTDTSRGPATRP